MKLVAALSYPRYRLLWASALAHNTARWIETVVGVWMVLALTDSAFLVGVLGICRFASMLLGPLCGTIADRFNRKNVLATILSVNTAAAVAVLLLFLTGHLQVWHLFALALVGGLNHTFDFSVRFVLAADLVDPSDLAGATSLLFVASGMTSVIGSLLGGSLFRVIGPGGLFALISALLLASVAAVASIRMESGTVHRSRPPGLRNLIEGLHYIREDRSLAALILFAALVNLLVFPCWFVLIPIFGREVFQAGAGGIGQLMASVGFGTLSGSFIAASLQKLRSKGGALVTLLIAWPAFLILFSLSRVFALSLALLVVAGLAQGLSITLIQILLLVWSEDGMRGRVSGARAFAISTIVLGNLMTGWTADLSSAALVMVVNCAASILITVLIALWAPQLVRRS